MSLVENIVNQISTNGLGGITKPLGFDPNDNSFEEILQGIGVNNYNINHNLQVLGNMGQPSGLVIEPFDESTKVQPVGGNEQKVINIEPIQIKDVDMGENYFSNLLKDKPQDHQILLNVAQKHASHAYNNFSKGLVENLTDFAKDVKSMI